MSVEWYAESIQLALFAGPNWIRRPLFTELTGGQPTDVAERRELHLQQEGGPFSNFFLRVNQQLGRIDIFLTDVPNRNTTNPSAPDYKKFFSIDTLGAAIPIFDQLIQKLPSFSFPLERLAYILTIILPTDDAKGAVSVLRPKLPLIQFNADVDTDVAWQINRPRTIPEIGLINRLSKWNIIQSGFVDIQIGVPTITAPINPTEFAARAQIDVNTSPAIREIFSEAVPMIITKLRSFALEIAEKGDVP